MGAPPVANDLALLECRAQGPKGSRVQGDETVDPGLGWVQEVLARVRSPLSCPTRTEGAQAFVDHQGTGRNPLIRPDRA
jgi:hypothetical protein